MLILEDDLTPETVATALILAKHDNNSGRFTQAFVLSSMASRMAMALGLHKELPPEHQAGTAERETRRRLMWGCYCLERMMHTGIPEFILTQASSIKIRLPCDDYQYLLGIPRFPIWRRVWGLAPNPTAQMTASLSGCSRCTWSSWASEP
jgi:hypothetical protein